MTRAEIIANCEKGDRLADQLGKVPLTNKQNQRIERMRKELRPETEAHFVDDSGKGQTDRKEEQ